MMQESNAARLGALTAALLLAACAPRTAPPAAPGDAAPVGAAPAAPRLPAIPERAGALAIDVVYPGENAAVTSADSTFVFGSVGTGGATLTINGAPVAVAPNGAWLAYLPVPADGVYRVAASAGGQTVTLERRVRVPAAAAAATAAGERLAIVPTSIAPRGAMTVLPGERIEVRFRGTPGAEARLRLPDGTVVPLAEQPVVERAEGFMLDRQAAARGVSEYAGTFAADVPLLARDTAVAAPALAPLPAAAGAATLELMRGGDTVRAPLPASVALLPDGAPRAAVAATAREDGTVIGTAVAGGNTPYHWFFPNGARLAITGERGGEYRVRLTSELSVWVGSGEVRLLAAGLPAPRGAVGTVRAIPAADHVDIRLSTSARLPFRVDGGERGLTITVYGAETRTNWVQYGAEDPLIRSLAWQQPSDDVYRVEVELSEPLWGFLPRYDDAGNLVVRVRRPPAIDPAQPLRGLLIGVDAGHPPGGAIGPTRLTEAEANLAIAKRLVPLLEQAGARVLELRPDTAGVALGARPLRATEAGVHLLVSVHNNAFPDGVNPFENNGTSVFYNQPQSRELARHMQHELVREFGLRDLGIARADLALVRPTWMPSVLTETMFLMVPEQEAALRDAAVQERVARAHLRALEAFVRERAPAAR